MSSTRLLKLAGDLAGSSADVDSGIAAAASIIRAGGTVAFPTETVYGLGANATDAAAVAKIYIAKQRALNDPLIVHCAPRLEDPLDALEVLARDQVIGDLTSAQQQRALLLSRAFWPGPLTLVLPRGPRIPTNVTAGLDTVAVRMPNHPVALALIRQSGVPIAAPSANRFGHVSPTSAQHVLDDLDGRIDMVLDGGPTAIGVESTVLDLTSPQPVILRPGGLTREEIERVIGSLGAWEHGSMGGGEMGRRGDGEPSLPGSLPPLLPSSPSPKAPGMLNKHYAPQAELRVMPDLNSLLRERQALVSNGLKVGLLIQAKEVAACIGFDPQFVLGDTTPEIARNLYAGLRALDGDGVDVILVSPVERAGLGEAIADRLKRGTAKD